MLYIIHTNLIKINFVAAVLTLIVHNHLSSAQDSYLLADPCMQTNGYYRARFYNDYAYMQKSAGVSAGRRGPMR